MSAKFDSRGKISCPQLSACFFLLAHLGITSNIVVFPNECHPWLDQKILLSAAAAICRIQLEGPWLLSKLPASAQLVEKVLCVLAALPVEQVTARQQLR